MLTMPTYDKVFFWKSSIHRLDSTSQANVRLVLEMKEAYNIAMSLLKIHSQRKTFMDIV